jgi:hypothetical protein
MPPRPVDDETMLRELGLRPVWGNWYGRFALTHDNDVMFFPSNPPWRPREPQARPEAVVDGQLQRKTYIWAAIRFPDLAHLMPQQGADDPTCSHCGGSGVLSSPSAEPIPGNLPCWCGGLGWLPDGVGLLEFQ